MNKVKTLLMASCFLESMDKSDGPAAKKRKVQENDIDSIASLPNTDTIDNVTNVSPCKSGAPSSSVSNNVVS